MAAADDRHWSYTAEWSKDDMQKMIKALQMVVDEKNGKAPVQPPVKPATTPTPATTSAAAPAPAPASETKLRFVSYGRPHTKVSLPMWARVRLEASYHNSNLVATTLCTGPITGGRGESYFLSASEGRLNVWSCPADPISSRIRGDPFQLVTSENSENYITTSLDMLKESGHTLSVYTQIGTNNSVVRIMDMRPEAMMRVVGTIESPLRNLIVQAAALENVGSVAINTISELIVFDLQAGNSKPSFKGMVSVPDKPLTALRSSPYCGDHVLLGTSNGGILLYDVKVPPSTPALSLYGHSRPITGLEMVNEYTLVSSGADCAVHWWDLRNAVMPFFSLNPDSKPVLSLRVAPLYPNYTERNGPLIAASTMGGIYDLSLHTGTTLLTPASSKVICPSLAWAQESPRLYAGSSDGCVIVLE